ncbi:MAG: UDP-glucose/GDP-mannose dehydrogenase family protein [Aigarchaeota archaeon]|nr:UDP-glucose/GDP-mannose dehydrogenase family protein [Candidatus Pelearchaeum maunauluense]
MTEKVAVIGLGYVGLTLACALASRCFQVTGLDVDEEKLEKIRRGTPPIYEEGLEPLLNHVLKLGALKVTSDYQEAVRESEACFICVGTPSNPDGSVDLRYVEETARMLGKALKDKPGYYLVVVRSTVPPGTTRNLVRRILEEESGRSIGDFGLCFNPEFLREGKALEDTFNPDRIVIGCVDRESGEKLLVIYRKFYGDKLPPTLITTLVNAELIKYVSNAFLATKISFINMVSQLCQALPGADVKVVAEGMGMDKRIGREFLAAGLGWGGSCFPKDALGLLRFGEELGVQLPIVEAAIKVNESQIEHTVKLAEELIGDLGGKLVAVLGLAFKPGTDDIRESRSIRLVEKLLERGARVRVHDPKAIENARKVLGERVSYAGSIEECMRGAELCILATEWPQYRRINAETLKRLMKTPALLDGRRLYKPEEFREIKFKAIGLGDSNQEP